MIEEEAWPPSAGFNNSPNKEEQLRWLMDEYGQSVIRLAYTYVRQKQASEDIAQEVFIKCFKNLEHFRHESSYKTWLYRITVNHCKDFLKSWAYKNVVFTEFIQNKMKGTSKSTETEIIFQEENKSISENVISLPMKFREVIILHYYEGLGINEIADLLSISPNTIKSRMHRARQLLKKLLEGGNYDGQQP